MRTLGCKKNIVAPNGKEAAIMEEKKSVKTALGMDENIEGLLCYILGFISGVFFLLIEKDNKFIKFHAIQSVLTSAALFVAAIVAGIIPFFGWIVLFLLGPVSIALWLLLMYKAFKCEMFKLPFVGDIAEKQIQ